MAITQYYVDPVIAGNSGTGTIGDPFGDLQYALNTISRNITDGDQINIKAGTAEVLAASLTLATYGSPATTVPLVLSGYTNAANDGGVGEIDCGGVTLFAATTYDGVVLADLEIHSAGDNNTVTLDSHCMVFRCEIHKGASTPSSAKYLVATGNYGSVIGCYLHDSGGRGVVAVYGLIYGCFLKAVDGLNIVPAAGTSVIGNVVSLSNTGAAGIYCGGEGNNIIGNTIYNSTAGTANGINSASDKSTLLNNVLVGFSGVNGEGISNNRDVCAVGYNAFWNNTAQYTNTGMYWLDLTANDVALGADPFTDAANDDFSLTEAAQTALRSAGWPAAYLGAHANTDPHITIGALQYGPTPAASGGGGPVVGSRIIRGLGAL